MFDPNLKIPPSTSIMAKLFFKLALPAMFTNVFAYSCTVANVIFAGRMNDPTKLAVVGLANVFIEVLI